MLLFRSSLRAAATVALLCAALGAQAQAYVSGSVSGQLAPGVYGRVDIGNAAPPVLLYQQPMLIAPPAVMVQRPPPIYMWVPPGHAKNWRKHCARYGVCGQPVYFLKNPPPHWRGQAYREGYRDGHRQERRWREEDRRHREWEHRRDDHRGERRHGRDDDRRGHGRGPGRGHHDD